MTKSQTIDYLLSSSTDTEEINTEFRHAIIDNLLKNGVAWHHVHQRMGSLNWYTLGIDNTRCSMYGELAHDLVKNLKIRKQEDPTSVNLQGIIEKLSDPEIVELIASNSQYLYLVPEVKAEPKKDSPWYKEIQRIPGKLVVYDDSDYGPPAVRGISIAYPYIQSAPTKELAKTLREAFYGKSFGTRVSEGISGSIKKIKESLLHAA